MSEPTVPSWLAAPAAAWSRAVAVWGGLSKAGRVLLGSTLGAAVLLTGWLATRSAFESYTPLFASLRPEDAGAIVAKLRELKVPYRISGAGTIEVPESRAAEVRMDLATTGRIASGDDPTPPPITATDQERKEYARRQLESQIGHTIQKIDGVQEARVHLALSNDSVFVRDKRPATASVLVDLAFGKQLSKSEVTGIVDLVARSVKDLDPDQVSLMTTDGIVLHRARHDAGGDSLALDDDEAASREEVLAEHFEDKIRSLLERSVGHGHVDVKASVVLDADTYEVVTEGIDPTSATPVVKETTIERGDTVNDTEGVSGGEGNLPGAEGATATTLGPVKVQREGVKNELSRRVEKRKSTRYRINRVTAAVLVDHATGPDGARAPRSREELDVLAGLASSAIGLDPLRGDMLTIETASFSPPPLLSDVGPPGGPVPEAARKFGPLAAAGVLVLVIAAATARSLVKKRKGVRAGGLLEPPLVLTGPDPARELAKAPSSYRDEAFRRAAEDPATAALVIRAWLGVEGEALPEVTVKA
jgi:flagellar M-ring protein FliF